MTNEVTPQAVKDWIAKLAEHLKRAEVMLGYLDKAFDGAVTLIDSAPTGNLDLHARFEPFICIFPLAPIDKIAQCIAGGGLVCAIIGTKAQWLASAISNKNNVLVVQITKCDAAAASVVYSGGDVDTIANPGKMILAGALFWVGG